MKLTKSQLKRIIKEESEKVIQEARELPPWLRKKPQKRGQRPALHIPSPPEKPPSSPPKPKSSTKVDYRLEEEYGRYEDMSKEDLLKVMESPNHWKEYYSAKEMLTKKGYSGPFPKLENDPLEIKENLDEGGWQKAAEDYDRWRDMREGSWNEMEEDLLIMFLARRTRYRQYVVQFANEFGMYKGDILDAVRKLPRSNALYVQLKGYLDEPPGYRRHHSWSKS